MQGFLQPRGRAAIAVLSRQVKRECEAFVRCDPLRGPSFADTCSPASTKRVAARRSRCRPPIVAPPVDRTPPPAVAATARPCSDGKGAAPARIAAKREPEGKNALPRLGALCFAVLALIGLAGLASPPPRRRTRRASVSIRFAPRWSKSTLRSRTQACPTATSSACAPTTTRSPPKFRASSPNSTPKLEASVKRLTELTPKSKDKAPETDAVTGQLAAEQKVARRS